MTQNTPSGTRHSGAAPTGRMRTSDELIGRIIAEILPDRFAKYGGLVGTATDYPSTTDCTMVSRDGHAFRIHEVVLIGRWPGATAQFVEDDKGEKRIQVGLSKAVTALLIDYLYGKPLALPTLDEVMELFNFAFKNSLSGIVDEYAEVASELLTPQNFLKAYDIKLNGLFPFVKECEMRNFQVHNYATYHLVESYYKYADVRAAFYDLGIKEVKFLLEDHTLRTSDEKLVFEIAKSWMIANDSINAVSMETLISAIYYNKYNFSEVHLPVMEFILKHDLPQVVTPLPRYRLPRDALVFFGLYNNKNPLTYYVDLEKKAIHRFPHLDCHQFMQVPRFTSVGGTIAQIGGATDAAIGFAKADCFKFDKKEKRWRRISSLPFERAHPAICAGPDGAIYHVGGHSQLPRKKLKHVEVYTPNSNTWKSLPKMIDGRYKAAAIYVSGKLIVSGGMNEDAALTSVETLPRFATHWTAMTPMAVPRSGHQMVSYNKHIYVLGGKNIGGELKTVERIHEDFGGTWRDMPDMTFSRVNFAAEVFDNKIFVFGGEHPIADGRPLTVEFFNGTHWSPFCTLPPDVLPLSAIAFYNIPTPEKLLFDIVNREERAAAATNNPRPSRKRPFSRISV